MRMGSQDGSVRICGLDHHGHRFRPLNGFVGPLINGRTPWLINGGDPNYLVQLRIQVLGSHPPSTATG